MSGVFGFRVAEDHLQTITQWRASIEPHIIEHYRRRYPPAWLDLLVESVWPVDGGEHIVVVSPIGQQDWKLHLSLLPEMFPPLSLDLERGIDVLTAFPADEYSYDDSDISRVHRLLSTLFISRGLYTQMVKIGWTLGRARQYEYYIHPSGLSTNARVRAFGRDEWVILEDPDFDP